MSSSDPSPPTSMQAIALSKYCKPDEYGLATLPVPKITEPDDILIKVHAASINPIDVKVAQGMMKAMVPLSFPAKIAYDVAGEVAAIGSSVTKFHIGDTVYSRVPEKHRGTLAEYALSTESATAKKPSTLSFVEAASIPLAALTAFQAFQDAESRLPGGLKGKTVFVPGGLSATGGFAVQLAKHYFGAGKVITTLSTSKIPLLTQFVGEGVVDQVVDYTKEDVNKTIGAGTVDFMFDPVNYTLSSLPVMKPGGLIITISTVPSGLKTKEKFPASPYLLILFLDLVNWYYTWRTRRKGVDYSYIYMSPDGRGLEKIATLVDEGRFKPLVGSQAKLDDIEAVKKGCEQVLSGKGGVGKFVIQVVA